MFEHLAFLAHGPVITGSDLGLLFVAVLSIGSGAIMAVVNLFLFGVLKLGCHHHVWRHVLGWFVYVGLGFVAVLGAFASSTFSFGVISFILMSLAIIIAFHLAYLVRTIGQRSNADQPADPPE